MPYYTTALQLLAYYVSFIISPLDGKLDDFSIPVAAMLQLLLVKMSPTS